MVFTAVGAEPFADWEFFIMRHFSRTCWVMVWQLEQGWFFLWDPLFTSLISMYLNAQFFRESPVLTAVAVCGLLAVCGGLSLCPGGVTIRVIL